MVINILTCNLNGNRINCLDNVYTRAQLKSWSDRNILFCPICGEKYEYCHGKIITPYFRHKDKKLCLDIYSESETEEHKKGKIALYEWANKQTELTDVILEGWIPGTRQRPDLMFKHMNTQYVVEFQCSPISSEFYERHELYQAGGIIDIWITGTERYNLKSSRRRGYTIERFAIASFDVALKEICFNPFHMLKSFPECGGYSYNLPNTHLLEQCSFNSGLMNVSSDYIKDALSNAKAKYEIKKNKEDNLNRTTEIIFSTLECIKDKYDFTITNQYSPYYIAKIEFQNGHVAFVKKNKIDYCVVEFGNMPQYGYSYKKKRSIITGYRDRFYYQNIESESFEQITCDCLIASIDTFCSKLKGGD